MSEPPTPRRDVGWLIFDGDCGFCTASATWLGARLDRPGDPIARRVPWQYLDLAALGITVERARREVLWLAPDGAIEGGAAALAAWLRFRGGAYGLVGNVLAAPLIRTVAAAAYRLIARNRYRLPGGSPACALPPPGVDPARPGQSPGSTTA